MVLGFKVYDLGFRVLCYDLGFMFFGFRASGFRILGLRA